MINLYVHDCTGNVYVADYFNQRIRKVTVSTGIVSTITGTGVSSSNTGSYSGDGASATSATLCYPVGVAIDSSGIILAFATRS